MSLIRIEIADCVVQIETIYPLINAMWQKFYTDKPVDFKVCTSLAEIEREKLFSIPKRNGDPFYESRIESLVVHRKICEKMVDYDTFLMHGAALAIDNAGILFCGKSGTGKTTHLLKWLDNCSNARVINGDKPFIKTKGTPMLCGSPWGGKENMCNNISYPLHVVAFLQQADENQITELSFKEAFLFLLQNTYRPNDPAQLSKTLKMLKRLNGKVKFYHFLSNNFKDDCFDVAYSAMLNERREM